MPASPSGPLYIDDAQGNIGTVDVQTGAVKLIGNTGVNLTDIAFTADGTLFGTSFSGLYSINKTTAAATLVLSYGLVGSGGMNALVGAGSVLYAASNSTQRLYAINEATLAISTVAGQLSGFSAGDLAFSGTSLYETLGDGSLSQINLGSAGLTSTIVGNTGNPTVYGLATADNGVTYAVSGTTVYATNLLNASLSPLVNFSTSALGFANGTAFLSESPVTTNTNPDGSTTTGVATGGNTIRITSGTVNTGGGGNTVILGTGPVTVQSGGTDTIFGGAGTATVNAGTGNVIAVGSTGALLFNAGAGTSIVFSGAGGLTFVGGAGAATVVAGPSKATISGGSGGGTFFGGGNSTIAAGAGAQTVLVGSNGDTLFSAGSTGDLFGVTGGSVVMSGLNSTGNDVFFGATGTGTLTFITGSGNDILGLGQGTNSVTLGAGHSTVFANTGKSGVSTIKVGTGGADIGLGGAAVNVIIAAGSAARNVALYNFVPGADRITLSGYSATTSATALANQTTSGGTSLLTLGDGTNISLVGVAKAPTNLFG